MKGAYLLIMKLPRDTRIQVGKQGVNLFRKGYYVYVGSALNGLEQRVQRHRRSAKKLRWHIDYLLTHATITDVFIKEGSRREECDIARRFEQTLEMIPGFGCSDCACQSHLFFGSIETVEQLAFSLQMEPYSSLNLLTIRDSSQFS